VSIVKTRRQGEGRKEMEREGEEYMSRRQQEAEIAKVSILIITIVIITRQSMRANDRERRREGVTYQQTFRHIEYH